MTDTLKNIVVIGAGLVGAETAHRIADKLPATHRVIVVSATSVGYWTVASPRAAVVPGFEEKITVSLDHFWPQNSRHILLTGTKVTKLNAHSVVIDKADARFGSEIPFEYCVIATVCNLLWIELLIAERNM